MLLLLGTACSPGDRPERAGTTSRDSAGIRIVEVGPIPDDLPVWTTTRVLVDIGQVEGEAPYLPLEIGPG